MKVSLALSSPTVWVSAGWAGHAIAKIIDTALYEVVIVSPRGFFLFTPMLAGSAVVSAWLE